MKLFCEYFTNIGVNLAKDIPNSTVSHRSYLSGNYVNSMSLELTTEEEIVEIINLLRSGTAAGCDNVPISALKNSVSVISEPIAHIINLSISQNHKTLDDVPLSAFLPSEKDTQNLRQDFSALWSHVIVKNFKAFAFLRNAVIYHIPHIYSELMSEPVEKVL